MLKPIFADKTDDICQRCLKLAWDGKLVLEAIMPLPKCPALGLDGLRCCHDCESADTLIKMFQVPGFGAARIAVANERHEQFRLPGALLGLVQDHIVRPCAAGDFERHLEWLKKNGLY